MLLVRPYTNDICAHWRFVDEDTASKSAAKIYSMFVEFRVRRDFIGMDMARKFLEMGFTRARRYANHSDGRKYDQNGKVLPQEVDWRDNEKAKTAQDFKVERNKREGKRRLVYSTTKEFCLVFPPSLYFYFRAKQTQVFQMLSLWGFYDIKKELKIPSQFSSKHVRRTCVKVYPQCYNVRYRKDKNIARPSIFGLF